VTARALLLGALAAAVLCGCASRQPAQPVPPPSTVVVDIAPAERLVLSSALDERNLHWTLVSVPSGDGGIWTARKDSGVDALALADLTFPANLVVFDGALYWTASTARKPGSPGTVHRWETFEREVQTVAEDQAFPSDLVVTADGLFWTTDAGCVEGEHPDPRRRGSGDGAIRWLAHDASEPMTLVDGLCAVHGLSVGVDGVHWVTSLPTPAGEEIVEVMHGVHPVEGLTASGGSRTAVTVGDRTFWTGWDAVMVSEAGQPAGVPFVAAQRPSQVAADDTYLYWVEGDFDLGFLLFRTPLAGGPRQRLARDVSPTVGLHVDDEHVHWVVFGGRWHRIPR